MGHQEDKRFPLCSLSMLVAQARRKGVPGLLGPKSSLPHPALCDLPSLVPNVLWEIPLLEISRSQTMTQDFSLQPGQRGQGSPKVKQQQEATSKSMNN